MKRIYFWFLIVGMVGIICWLLFTHHLPAIFSEQPVTNGSATNQAQPISQTSRTQQVSAQEKGRTLVQSNNYNSFTMDTNKPHTMEEWTEREYSHNFLFYGKVVDQHGAPVEGARASFQWATPQGVEQYASSFSDNLGLFSLEKGKGYKLLITVGKSGYYTPNSEGLTTIAYGDESGRETFKANPANPIIFHLRKKGVGVDLITSQSGISPNFQIHIPREGTPVKIDLLQRKTGNAGQLQVSESKPEFSSWKTATNWWFRIEIPGGGFVGENDEFPFEAPESGYQPVVEFSFQQGNPDWTRDINTNFYIEFGNPPLYGRLQVQTGISYGGATLTYAINPTGTRNLEPQ